MSRSSHIRDSSGFVFKILNSDFFRDYTFELFNNLGLNLGLEQKYSILSIPPKSRENPPFGVSAYPMHKEK